MLNAFGILFHYSALVYLPCYALFRRELPHKVLFGIIGLGIVAFPLFLPLLDWVPAVVGTEHPVGIHLSTYVQTYSTRLVFTLPAVERLLTASALFVLYDRLCCDSRARLGAYTFLAYFLAYTLLSRYAILATRVANLFVCGYWLLWPSLLRAVPSCRWRIAAAVVITLYLGIRLYDLSAMPHWHYTTVLG